MICSTKHNDATDFIFLFFKQIKLYGRSAQSLKLCFLFDCEYSSDFIGGRSVPCLVTHWGQAEITNQYSACVFVSVPHLIFHLYAERILTFSCSERLRLFFFFFFCLQLSFSPEDKLMLI